MLRVFLFVLFYSSFSIAECLSEDVIPGEYIIRLKKQDSAAIPYSAEVLQATKFYNFLIQGGATVEKIFNRYEQGEMSSYNFSTLPPTTAFVKTSSSPFVEQIRSHSAVDTVESNCRMQLLGDILPAFATNDPLGGQMWNLKKIQAEEAWTLSKGSSTIIVGISDTGVDYNHEDLKANMWVNTKELPGNGIDDDNNGCVDDIYGCDFADNDGDPNPGTYSNLTHGTHVAGTSAAVGNNSKGISGIVQSAKIMALKGFTYQGVGDSAALLKTIYYGVNNGARVINCSWGRQGSYDQADLDAFEYAYNNGVVMVVAAGNSNKDTSYFTPANIPHVISVAATDSTDQIATFSNWGNIVKVAAPGGKGYDASGNSIDSILSTIPQNKYAGMIGTSMAAPHVTGLVALILSINPNLSPAAVLQILQDGGDLIHVTTSGSGLKFDYKRINAFNSAKLALATTGGGPGTGKPSCPPGVLNCSSSLDTNSNLLKNNFFQTSGCGSITRYESEENLFYLKFSSMLLMLLPFGAFLLRYKKQKAPSLR